MVVPLEVGNPRSVVVSRSEASAAKCLLPAAPEHFYSALLPRRRNAPARMAHPEDTAPPRRGGARLQARPAPDEKHQRGAACRAAFRSAAGTRRICGVGDGYPGTAFGD